MSVSPDTFADKHPLTNRPYSVDFSADLDTNEKVASAVWSFAGDDAALTITGQTVSTSGLLVSAWLGAGTLGGQYKITVDATTDSVPPKNLVVTKYINIRDVLA